MGSFHFRSAAGGRLVVSRTPLGSRFIHLPNLPGFDVHCREQPTMAAASVDALQVRQVEDPPRPLHCMADDGDLTIHVRSGNLLIQIEP